MASDYLIVHKKLLPEHLDKVIEARKMVQNHEVESITEAVLKVGISRNTYYKYKDYVFTYEEEKHHHHVVITLVLKHEEGSLSAVLTTLSALHASVVTISQAIPIADRATVTIALELLDSKGNNEDIIAELKKLPQVISVSFSMIE